MALGSRLRCKDACKEEAVSTPKAADKPVTPPPVSEAASDETPLFSEDAASDPDED